MRPYRANHLYNSLLKNPPFTWFDKLNPGFVENSAEWSVAHSKPLAQYAADYPCGPLAVFSSRHQLGKVTGA